MTDHQALARGLALVPELRRDLATLNYKSQVLAQLRVQTIIAALEAAERIVLAVELIQNIDKTGQHLLDALMVRFPDLKDHPDMIHSTDVGKGLLKAIREFHLAWADLGMNQVLKMTDAEVLADLAAIKPEKEGGVMNKDRADFVLKCQTLIQAIMEASEDAATVKRLKDDFEGYSFDYFHRSDIERAEKSAERAGIIMAELLQSVKL